MGSSEEAKPSKPENSSSSATDQNNFHHAYPDWAAMQAYYGPRFAVPPYLNSHAASTHAPPPYMWAPMQSMIPPYGAHYAALYAHGGVYGHPGVPIGTTALSMDTQMKSSGNTDGGFMKKLKEFDGLAASMSNGNGGAAEHGTAQRLSESTEETEGSSDGSNGVVAGARQSRKKRSQQESPNSAGDTKASSVHAAEVGRGSEKMIDMIPPVSGPVKAIKNTSTALEPSDTSDHNLKSSPANVPQLSLPSEAWVQNEREVKRERRKQSNRESARRSRLRKQAETGELATKVQKLTSENLTLKSEINRLTESSNKLRLENATLMEKFEVKLQKIDDLSLKPVGTVNLLARVNNNDNSIDRRNEGGENSYKNRKLHQLLDASPRADAVAAG